MFKKSAKGFTLIELLIVIAVLGILAVAVLSAINPIEQINRSNDTGSRSDAEQLIGAIDRYYATATYYPWQASADESDSSVNWTAVTSSTPTDGAVAILTKLSEEGTGELKASFTDRISKTTYNTMFIYNSGDAGASTYVCFMPKSSSFETAASERCGASLPSDYPGSACNNTTDCGTGGSCSCLP